MGACNPCVGVGVNGGPGSGGSAPPGFSATEIVVDFSLWAATDFAAGGDGPYVLNGGSGNLTWTVASSANANAGLPTGGFFRRNAADVGDDGASGLRIFHDQAVLTTLSRATQTGPRISIPLGSLIPNFDPTRSYLFELEFNRFQDNGLAFTTQSDAVMQLFQAAGTPGGSTARMVAACLQRFAANDANPSVLAGNATRLPITAYTYQGGANVLAFTIGPSQNLAAFSGHFGANWPANSTLNGLGATSEVVDNNASNMVLDALVTLGIGLESRQNNTGAIDVMFRQLRVLQGP